MRQALTCHHVDSRTYSAPFAVTRVTFCACWHGFCSVASRKSNEGTRRTNRIPNLETRGYEDERWYNDVAGP